MTDNTAELTTAAGRQWLLTLLCDAGVNIWKDAGTIRDGIRLIEAEAVAAYLTSDAFTDALAAALMKDHPVNVGTPYWAAEEAQRIAAAMGGAKL